jgi:DNA-binding response OmpR family regulator
LLIAFGEDAHILLVTDANRWLEGAPLSSGSRSGTSSAGTILVVDDEPTLRDTIAYNLRREGFDVLLAADGVEALALARGQRPDLLVLDIMLPGIDGLQVLRTLRAESTVPILLLSARGDEFDRVLGLELGADDYLPKPFAMRELIARVRAGVRRARMAAPEASPAPEPTGRDRIVAGALVIDTQARIVTFAGDEVALKPKEFDLLVYLARHPGVALTREALLREVWGYAYPVDTRTIDVHVRGLRQKLEADTEDGGLIETVRGHGYRFAARPGARG